MAYPTLVKTKTFKTHAAALRFYERVMDRGDRAYTPMPAKGGWTVQFREAW